MVISFLAILKSKFLENIIGLAGPLLFIYPVLSSAGSKVCQWLHTLPALSGGWEFPDIITELYIFSLIQKISSQIF